MAVPVFHAFLHPLLEVLADGQEHRVSDLYETVAGHMGLTAEDRAEMLPSGKQRRYANRIGWAKTCLLKAVPLAVPRRGAVRVTGRGQLRRPNGLAVRRRLSEPGASSPPVGDDDPIRTRPYPQTTDRLTHRRS